MNDLQNQVVRKIVIGALSFVATTYGWAVYTTLKHETEIQILKEDIRFIKETVTDIKNEIEKKHG